ncbi:MAG: DAK2 domain-containing protein [Oscillospiraceae bacterium]|jgi:DAK2 domain fusion protein YloV|nr:DAK2 domain-containing protein [Oscillospiraceae bacterium]
MISGTLLRDAVISGANAIINSKRAVDELNIFPVPDGDTGTNMSMSISAAAKELEKLPEGESVSRVADLAASALLRGARGNSGVILSLLFRGFSKGLKDIDHAGGADLANALTLGVEAAYKAVMKPTEGTMLTVARVAAEQARAAIVRDDDANHVWDIICKAAEEALETTPDLLPVLKRAGVVDAGGKGVCIIFRGMQSVFRDNIIVAKADESDVLTGVSDETFRNIVGQFDEVINFTYCTEFIIEKENDKDPLELRAFLETIGDCVVVVDDDEIIKVHVHTNSPDKAIGQGLTYGSMITSKIENMREQHKNAGNQGESSAPKKLEYQEPVEELGFIAVAAGEGLITLFKDLGCNHVVSGGQTMNPSTDDILAAVQATPAKTVFVLPNNKNIIMAAEQVVPLADRRVVVLPTKTIPQGIAAMLAFDPDAGIDENSVDMFVAAEKVDTGLVTYAARDSEFAGKKIKENEVLGLANGKLVFTEKDPVKAAVRLTKLLTKRDSAFVTIIYGNEVTDKQAEEARTQIQQRVASDVEITVIDGGQPVYYFMISVE